MPRGTDTGISRIFLLNPTKTRSPNSIPTPTEPPPDVPPDVVPNGGSTYTVIKPVAV